MSDAVENAQVVVCCISESYKESGNCRLELQYTHQQEKEIVPLLMEDGYRATGWLGLLLGTKLWFGFHAKAVATDADFLRQLDLVERELGERGKGSNNTLVILEDFEPVLVSGAIK